MKAACIGAGVVGAGWAARFAVHGWDVAVYDPRPDALANVQKVRDRARRCLAELYDKPAPAEGDISLAATLADAVEDVSWVQESIPERLRDKRDLYAAVSDFVSVDTPIASSTSGFKPSDLSARLACADRLLVCHPFQPVYLLPAVEVVPGQRTANRIVEKARSILDSIGMIPLIVDVEIDGHIADRLLEAMWREALWLVKDGVATTNQIDSLIRNGFGLRWAQMGMFETYRIAGGEAGMRHFLAQFGPALEWPWSRLTDVPELDDALVEKIAAQSDAEAGHATIDGLTEQRDRNLVAILKALRATNGGAGRSINEFDARRKHNAVEPDEETG